MNLVQSTGGEKPCPAWLLWRKTRSWRLVGTAIGFGLFGVGTGLFSLSLFPLLYFAPLPRRLRQTLARRLIGGVFRFYLYTLQFLGLISYETHRVNELLKPPQLIVANHPSLLDVVFLISFIGDTNCVVKSSLWRNPFTALAVRAAGYIRNDHPQLMAECVGCLTSGQSLIVFPEGTRSKPGQALKFHRGPANIALCAKVAMTPVVIHCHPITLMKNQKWYEIPQAPPHYVFQVQEPINSQDFLGIDNFQSTAARKLTRHLVESYSVALGLDLTALKDASNDPVK